jgi:leucyl-tRNA synthetase
MIALDGQRMSKSRGNVITPDSVVATFGADALRIYELFMAPFDQDISWSDEGISGARRFLNRVWHLYASAAYTESGEATGSDPDLEAQLHRTIRKVSERIERFRFNTMVSTLMEFSNLLSDRYRDASAWRTRTFHEALDILPILLAPSAPHIAEELWELTGHTGSVHQQAWPEWDAELAREEVVEIPVQIDGKVRALVAVSAGADEAEVKEKAYAHPKVRQHLDRREVVKEIYVEGKVYSVVTR